MGLVALSVAAATALAWQLVSDGPVHARSTGPKAPTRPTPPGTRPARIVTSQAAPSTTTTSVGPIRVVEIGDSLGVDLGDAMENTWPSASVQLTIAARSDTGLADTGYYDWATALEGLLASAHPQVVVVFLGANDLQSMVTGSTVLYDGTPAWNSEYATRVTAIISECVRSGAHVLWIGEPAMENAFIDAGMTRIDGIAQTVVAHFPDEATYLSSDSVLAQNGSFSFDLSEPTGQVVQVRTPDGVHLMPAGADLLAAAVAKTIASTWGMHVADQ